MYPLRIIVRLSRWYFSTSVSASISFSFAESMPWVSGEDTGQPRAGTSSEPNPAPVDKQKIESVKINSRATGIDEDVDRIGCAFPLLKEGLTIRFSGNAYHWDYVFFFFHFERKFPRKSLSSQLYLPSLFFVFFYDWLNRTHALFHHIKSTLSPYRMVDQTEFFQCGSKTQA